MSNSTQEQNFQLYDGYALNNADGYSFLSKPMKLITASRLGITINFTSGTPSGTLKLQVTNETDDDTTSRRTPGKNGSGGVAWADLSDSSRTISASGVVCYDLTNVASRWVRISYVASSGTCVLDVWYNVKE